LDDAGYVDTNKDGVRNMPNGGQELIFKLNFDTDPNYSRQAEILNESFTKIGVKLEIAPMESSALSPFVNPQFKHDLVIWGWSTGVDPDFMLSLTATSMIQNTSSEVGYSNAEYDALYKDQAIAATDDARKADILKMQEIFMRDVPYVVFFYKDTIFAYRTDKFAGFEFSGSKNFFSALSTPQLSQVYPVY
jgi:peptide/nickel transport system substrate-binding protein